MEYCNYIPIRSIVQSHNQATQTWWQYTLNLSTPTTYPGEACSFEFYYVVPEGKQDEEFVFEALEELIDDLPADVVCIAVSNDGMTLNCSHLLQPLSMIRR